MNKKIRVICLNTNEIFESAIEASEKYLISINGIRECCLRKRKTAGKINGEKGVWMYYKDYSLLSSEEVEVIYNTLKNNHCRKIKVICLNTKEIFNSIVEASKKYNVNASSIISSCKGKIQSAGKIEGRKIRWMYYDDYIKLTDEEIEQILNKKSLKKNEHSTLYNKRNIICLNTKEIFDSIGKASAKYNINKSTLSLCCNNKRKSAGKINGEKGQWMFYDDYLKLESNSI